MGRTILPAFTKSGEEPVYSEILTIVGIAAPKGSFPSLVSGSLTRTSRTWAVATNDIYFVSFTLALFIETAVLMNSDNQRELSLFFCSICPENLSNIICSVDCEGNEFSEH